MIDAATHEKTSDENIENETIDRTSSLNCQPNYKENSKQVSIVFQEKTNMLGPTEIKTQADTNESIPVDNSPSEICGAKETGFLFQAILEEPTTSLFKSCIRNNNDFIGMLLKTFIANSDMTPLINSDSLQRCIKPLLQIIVDYESSLKENEINLKAARETAFALVQQLESHKENLEKVESNRVILKEKSDFMKFSISKQQQVFINDAFVDHSNMDSLELRPEFEHQSCKYNNKNKKLEEGCVAVKKKNQLFTVAASQTEDKSQKISEDDFKKNYDPIITSCLYSIPPAPILVEESLTKHFESVLEEIMAICDKKISDEPLLKLPEQKKISVFRSNIELFTLYYNKESNCMISTVDTDKIQLLLASLSKDLHHECNKNSVNSVYRKYVENIYQCNWFTEKTYMDFIINYVLLTKFNSSRLYSRTVSNEQAKDTAVNHKEKNDTLPPFNTKMHDGRSVSNLAVPIFTELLSVLKSKTDNLLALEGVEEINTTVCYVIPVLETIEERIPVASDRLEFGEAARELFFSIVNIAKENYINHQRLHRTTEEFHSRQKHLLEAINEYRTMFIKPPDEEQLERANLKGRLVTTVLVEHDGYPSFILGCVELLPKFENNEINTQSSSNYSIWVPGFFWWRIEALEESPYWSDLVKNSSTSLNPSKDYVMQLKKTIQSQNEHSKLLQEEIKDLNIQFQDYKTKATTVFKSAKLLTSATLSKAVQCQCNDINDYSQNIKMVEKKFLKELERYKMELQEAQVTLENKSVEIKDLVEIIESWKEDNEALRELLSKEKILRQKVVDEYEVEKKQFEEQLRFSKSRIEKLTQNIFSNNTLPSTKSTHTQSDKTDICTDFIQKTIYPGSDQELRRKNSIDEPNSVSEDKMRKMDSPMIELQENKTTSQTFDAVEENQLNKSNLTALPSTLGGNLGATGGYIETLRRALYIKEHQLKEEKNQKSLLIEQIQKSKRKLEECQTILRIKPFGVMENESNTNVPIAFVRHTILQFILTGQLGTSEHEAIIPVIASFFSFTTEELKKIEENRKKNTRGNKWLLIR
ncbi:uncharacterized protein LOC128884099 isoform X2 [Hylaeus volcanicus]|uniref:uncharacterized protein LOC128884099 isoform X2 n=1 Tax=Hylaeus volcanicus TaxID=313075 RepID=UPI0023B8136D|nr:uncharacterized protein LOC128884099 isoform X2 [Hylaeus volcanicus]